MCNKRPGGLILGVCLEELKGIPRQTSVTTVGVPDGIRTG
jgi:hypothetical protein